MSSLVQSQPQPSPPPVASTSALQIEPQPVSQHQKAEGLKFWKGIGEPKYVVAPMVDQSELAWRILSRIHGATLAYTPMFHAGLFGSASHPRYADDMFDTSPESIEGVAPYDRPLVVQFCANEKDTWLTAAKKVAGRCDAVDLNLGCPQGIARKGHYGAFLMEEWDLIRDMISHLHTNLTIPVIAKLRVFPTLDKTLAYASHVYSSGAQLVTIHGRTREAKGRLAGFASWPKIKAVVDVLGSRVPVLANGGVPSAEEVEPCIEETGVKGVMSAEGNLYNPMIFSPSNAAGGREYRACLPDAMKAALDVVDAQLVGAWDRDAAAYAPATFLASQYLAIVRTIPHTQTSPSAIKAHLFKLFRPVWATQRHLDTREMLGRAGGGRSIPYLERVQQYQAFVDEMYRRVQADLAEGHLPPNSDRPLTHAEVQRDFGGIIPYSHAQPYMRVSSAEPVAEVKEDKIASKRAREEEELDQKDESEATTTDQPAEKRPKPSEPSLAEADSTAPPPSLVPKASPCANSARVDSPCANSAASKCPNGSCLACCGSGGTAGEEQCEFHKEKKEKERLKIEGKKKGKQARREVARAQQGKKGGQQNGGEASKGGENEKEKASEDGGQTTSA